MDKFVITSSSTCDLTPSFLEQHNIPYVSFCYYLNDVKFKDDFYTSLSMDDFYSKLIVSNAKTSQPDPKQYVELWSKLIEQGNDILHIELSSGISGAVNSALIAKSMVLEKYPKANIFVVDSLCASSGLGLLLDKVSEYKMERHSLDETLKYVENLKTNINHVFFMSSLDQLIKGGRISKLTGNVGKLLNIVPILHVDNAGKLAQIKKSRGILNAMDEIINIAKTNILNGENYNDKIFFVNSYCIDNCKKFYEKTKQIFNSSIIDENFIFNMGSVIASHTGAGTIAMFYVGNGRA